MCTISTFSRLFFILLISLHFLQIKFLKDIWTLYTSNATHSKAQNCCVWKMRLSDTMEQFSVGSLPDTINDSKRSLQESNQMYDSLTLTQHWTTAASILKIRKKQ